MVSSGFNASSMFMNAYYGLQTAYQYALPEDGTGVTQSDLLNNKNSLLALQSTPFSSYLVTNFSDVDKDKNGTITNTEMSELMTTFSQQGLSYQQLMALSGSSGISSTDLNNVLTNFRKIDKNGDGRVSMTEINYFNANKELDDKIVALKNKRADDISIFSDNKDFSKDE